MRRFTALALAGLVFLSASCGRQPAIPETTDAASLTAADDSGIALPETTQTISESPSQTETASTTEKPPVTTARAPETTTLPPSTTTAVIDESKLSQPPEDGSVPFTARTVRMYSAYREGFEPSAVVAASQSDLRDATVDAPDSAADYTDEWFATHRLIVITLQENSGSVRHNVRKVAYTGNGASFKIERLRPDVGTCDIAHWLIFIELPDTHLHAGDPVEIIWK